MSACHKSIFVMIIIRYMDWSLMWAQLKEYTVQYCTLPYGTSTVMYLKTCYGRVRYVATLYCLSSDSPLGSWTLDVDCKSKTIVVKCREWRGSFGGCGRVACCGRVLTLPLVVDLVIFGFWGKKSATGSSEVQPMLQPLITHRLFREAPKKSITENKVGCSCCYR